MVENINTLHVIKMWALFLPMSRSGNDNNTGWDVEWEQGREKRAFEKRKTSLSYTTILISVIQISQQIKTYANAGRVTKQNKIIENKEHYPFREL